MEKMWKIQSGMIYRVFSVCLLCGICVSAAGKLLGIVELSITQLITAVVGILFLAVMNYAKIRERLLWGICFLGIGGIWFLLADKEKLGAFCSSYKEWLTGGGLWEAEWLSWYGCVQMVLVVAGCYLFQVIAEQFFIIKKLAAVLLLVGLIIAMLMQYEISHVGVVLILWYLVWIYVEATQLRWKKAGAHEYRRYVLWLLPFLAVYLCLMLAMPMRKEPYDWAFVKNAYQNLREAAIISYQNLARRGQEDFGLAVSGFSEDGTLGGGFLEDKRAIMEIKGKGGLITNVYLTGKVYDTFNGREWTTELTGDENERFMDMLETLYAVECYDGEATSDYVANTSMKLNYQYLDTGYVFMPLKTNKIKGCEYKMAGANIMFEKQQGYGTEYEISFFQLNIDHPKFYQMMEQEFKPQEEIWRTLVRRYASHGEYMVTLSDLQQHRTYIYENYSGQVKLSEEAENYLGEITAGAETEIEKLRAIETELSSFTYTKMPGKLPEKVCDAESFLDYFLLESRQGYCSYYATAFVLLAQAEGIPARYVEGFCVPVNQQKNMTVYSNMAHAWPEVYIKNVGWIPFEPTPGYEEVRYTPWAMEYQGEEAFVTEPAFPWMAEETEDTEESIENQIGKETADSENTGRKMGLMLFGILGIMAVVLLLFLADRRIRRYRYRKWSKEQQFEEEVRKINWLLSKLGYLRGESQTLAEFKIQVDSFLQQEEGWEAGCSYLKYYEEYRYGGSRITDGIMAQIREEQKKLLLLIKKRRKLYYYIVWLRIY